MALTNLADLALAPGERLFVDRVEDGVATLLIGSEGREEVNVAADELPVECGEGAALRVAQDGSLQRDESRDVEDRAAIDALMGELFDE
jgi:hypothetical protein